MFLSMCEYDSLGSPHESSQMKQGRHAVLPYQGAGALAHTRENRKIRGRNPLFKPRQTP
jgi:hypothetical protein